MVEFLKRNTKAGRTIFLPLRLVSMGARFLRLFEQQCKAALRVASSAKIVSLPTSRRKKQKTWFGRFLLLLGGSKSKEISILIINSFPIYFWTDPKVAKGHLS